MNTTLTLIGKPGTLGDRLVATARESLGDAGIVTRTEIDWLSSGEACDIHLPNPLLGSERETVAAAFAAQGAEIDIVVQSTEHRHKHLIVADMDSTIVTCECIDELADAIGIKDRVAAITERAMRGEIAFEGALAERVALLKGLPVRALERVFAERVHLTAGAATLLATMRAQGAYALLVSGGFRFFTQRVAQLAGFDADQGNTLELSQGRLTGRVVAPILGREAKLAALRETAKKLGIPLAATLAVGDGANDLAMVSAAGLGVAYHAKPALAAAAGAVIEHGDLTALLFAQGYRRSDFISA